MIRPIPAVLENGAEKINGFVMKLTLTGVLFELDTISFRVGSILGIQIPLDESLVLVDRVRSIKHYDRYFRTPPKKGEPATKPKKLIEAHFINIKEENRQAILKFLMSLTVEELKKRK